MGTAREVAREVLFIHDPNQLNTYFNGPYKKMNNEKLKNISLFDINRAISYTDMLVTCILTVRT